MEVEKESRAFELGDLVRAKSPSILHPNYIVSGQTGVVTSIKTSSLDHTRLICEVGMRAGDRDALVPYWTSYFYEEDLEHVNRWWAV